MNKSSQLATIPGEHVPALNMTRYTNSFHIPHKIPYSIAWRTRNKNISVLPSLSHELATGALQNSDANVTKALQPFAPSNLLVNIALPRRRERRIAMFKRYRKKCRSAKLERYQHTRPGTHHLPLPGANDAEYHRTTEGRSQQQKISQRISIRARQSFSGSLRLERTKPERAPPVPIYPFSLTNRPVRKSNTAQPDLPWQRFSP